MREIGAAIGYTTAAHGDIYTLPAIRDGDAAVVDSLAIALHLDAHHPGPKLIPPGTRALQLAFLRWHGVTVMNVLADICCMACPAGLDDRGAEYFLRTRKEWYGQPLEEWVADRAAEWDKIREAYGKLAAIYDAAGEEHGEADAWLMGAHPTFADFAVAGCLLWIKKLVKEPGEGWEAVSQWHGGRWARFLAKCEPYMHED